MSTNRFLAALVGITSHLEVGALHAVKKTNATAGLDGADMLTGDAFFRDEFPEIDITATREELSADDFFSETEALPVEEVEGLPVEAVQSLPVEGARALPVEVQVLPEEEAIRIQEMKAIPLEDTKPSPAESPMSESASTAKEASVPMTKAKDVSSVHVTKAKDVSVGVAGNQSHFPGRVCAEWCSGPAYMSKSWEDKCRWRDCRQCGECFMNEQQQFQLHQAAEVAHAEHAARRAEAAALEAAQLAEQAEREATKREIAVMKAKATVEAEQSKLSKMRGVSEKKQGVCLGWCASAEYADKTWDKKCTWKDCTGCSACQSVSAIQRRSANVDKHQKKAVIDKVFDAVSQYLSDDDADMASLAKYLNITQTVKAKAEPTCEDKCSKDWVSGLTLQLQQSFKSWETRCTWEGCNGCHQCSAAPTSA